MKQGFLPLISKEDYSLTSWVSAPCNEAAYRWVLALGQPSEPRMAYVWGEEGSGKTHLAHIFASTLQGVVTTPEELAQTWGSSARDALSSSVSSFWAFDEVERGAPTWLFDAFNILKERHCTVLWLCRQPPSFWAPRLADIGSRFQSIPQFNLSRPDDETTVRLLSKWLHDRGVRLQEGALDYLLAHVPRDLKSLRSWVEHLDNAASLQQRPLTLSFIRQELAKTHLTYR